jgi:hypothetical protein
MTPRPVLNMVVAEVVGGSGEWWVEVVGEWWMEVVVVMVLLLPLSSTQTA